MIRHHKTAFRIISSALKDSQLLSRSSFDHNHCLFSTKAFQGIGRLNHIAIAVPNVDEAANKYKSTLGVTKVSSPQSLPEHGVKVVFVHLENTKLELLEPLGDNSPIANFLKKNPEGGMHHICLEVPDIHSAIDSIQQTKKVRLLNEQPKIGAHGTPVVFLHPKDMCGVLTELEQVD